MKRDKKEGMDDKEAEWQSSYLEALRIKDE